MPKTFDYVGYDLKEWEIEFMDKFFDESIRASINDSRESLQRCSGLIYYENNSDHVRFTHALFEDFFIAQFIMSKVKLILETKRWKLVLFSYFFQLHKKNRLIDVLNFLKNEKEIVDILKDFKLLHQYLTTQGEDNKSTKINIMPALKWYSLKHKYGEIDLLGWFRDPMVYLRMKCMPDSMYMLEYIAECGMVNNESETQYFISLNDYECLFADNCVYKEITDLVPDKIALNSNKEIANIYLEFFKKNMNDLRVYNHVHVVQKLNKYQASIYICELILKLHLNPYYDVIEKIDGFKNALLEKLNELTLEERLSVYKVNILIYDLVSSFNRFPSVREDKSCIEKALIFLYAIIGSDRFLNPEFYPKLGNLNENLLNIKNLFVFEIFLTFVQDERFFKPEHTKKFLMSGFYGPESNFLQEALVNNRTEIDIVKLIVEKIQNFEQKHGTNILKEQIVMKSFNQKFYDKLLMFEAYNSTISNHFGRKIIYLLELFQNDALFEFFGDFLVFNPNDDKMIMLVVMQKYISRKEHFEEFIDILRNYLKSNDKSKEIVTDVLKNSLSSHISGIENFAIFEKLLHEFDLIRDKSVDHLNTMLQLLLNEDQDETFIKNYWEKNNISIDERNKNYWKYFVEASKCPRKNRLIFFIELLNLPEDDADIEILLQKEYGITMLTHILLNEKQNKDFTKLLEKIQINFFQEFEAIIYCAMEKLSDDSLNILYDHIARGNPVLSNIRELLTLLDQEKRKHLFKGNTVFFLNILRDAIDPSRRLNFLVQFFKDFDFESSAALIKNSMKKISEKGERFSLLKIQDALQAAQIMFSQPWNEISSDKISVFFLKHDFDDLLDGRCNESWFQGYEIFLVLVLVVNRQRFEKMTPKFGLELFEDVHECLDDNSIKEILRANLKVFEICFVWGKTVVLDELLRFYQKYFSDMEIEEIITEMLQHTNEKSENLFHKLLDFISVQTAGNSQVKNNTKIAFAEKISKNFKENFQYFVSRKLIVNIDCIKTALLMQNNDSETPIMKEIKQIHSFNLLLLLVNLFGFSSIHELLQNNNSILRLLEAQGEFKLLIILLFELHKNNQLNDALANFIRIFCTEDVTGKLHLCFSDVLVRGWKDFELRSYYKICGFSSKFCTLNTCEKIVHSDECPSFLDFKDLIQFFQNLFGTNKTVVRKILLTKINYGETNANSLWWSFFFYGNNDKVIAEATKTYHEYFGESLSPVLRVTLPTIGSCNQNFFHWFNFGLVDSFDPDFKDAFINEIKNNLVVYEKLLRKKNIFMRFPMAEQDKNGRKESFVTFLRNNLQLDEENYNQLVNP